MGELAALRYENPLKASGTFPRVAEIPSRDLSLSLSLSL
jgi:hypothetical protein